MNAETPLFRDALSQEETSSSLLNSASSSIMMVVNSFGSTLMRLGTMTMGVAMIAGGLLYMKQESLLYFPEIGGIPKRPENNPRGYRSPEERQVPFREYMIPCSDGVRVHAWFLRRQQRPMSTGGGKEISAGGIPTIIFFHGNAGNIGLRLPNAVQMLQYLNANVLMVEYRGYGNSDNVSPTEAGIKLDAEASLRFVHDTIAKDEKEIGGNSISSFDPNLVFVFGRSLGGAVAFHLAEYAERTKTPLAGIIVENTFMSIGDMVDKILPFLSPIKGLVLRMHWNSYDIVKDDRLKETSVLYLAGDSDELVPHDHMLKLYAESKRTQDQQHSSTGGAPANSVVQMHVIKGGNHNETWLRGGQAYWDAVKEFLRRVKSLRRDGQMQGQTATTTTTSSSSSSTVTTAATSTTKGGEGASIPTMSTRLVDLAKDAVGGKGVAATTTKSSSSSSQVKDKKEL